MKNKFFCCCEFCGSITWVNSEGDSNTLDNDGNMLIEQDVWDDNVYAGYFCHECENPVLPILFKNMNRKERIKIYNMTDETRANWKKSCEIVDVLDESKGRKLRFLDGSGFVTR